MSSKIVMDNILIKNNPAAFEDNIEFEITFTALDEIPLPL
jgi:hypothetical protein